LAVFGLKQCSNLSHYFLHKLSGGVFYQLGIPATPVKTSYLIGEHRACHRSIFWKLNLERISLDLVGDRAEKSEPGLLVVGAGRRHQGGPPPPLFVAGLRREIEPDQISALGQITPAVTRPLYLAEGQSLSPHADSQE